MIFYKSANEIIALKKYVYADHCMIAKTFLKVKKLFKKPYERQFAKKRPHVNGIIVSNFFIVKDLYKKDDV